MTRSHIHAGRKVASFVALLVALSARGATADEPVTIVEVRSSNGALDKRLDAELQALGFTVRSVEPTDPPLDLEAIGKSYGATAAIRATPDDVVELWVVPRHAGDPPVHESVQVDARRGWSAAAVSALESMRARLLEIRGAPPPPAPPAPAPTPPPAPPSPAAERPSPSQPSHRWVWIHAGVGLDASPGGAPPGADVLVEARLDPVRWLSVAAFGAGTPVAAEMDAPEGKASVRRVVVGVALDVQKTLGLTTLAAGAGAALVPTFVHGTYAAPGFATRDSSSLAAAPLLRLSVAIAVAAPLRVRLALAGGVTFPETTTTFGDREVATWGRPFGLGTLGVEWGLGTAP